MEGLGGNGKEKERGKASLSSVNFSPELTSAPDCVNGQV